MLLWGLLTVGRWCGPQDMSAVLPELAEEYQDDVVFVELPSADDVERDGLRWPKLHLVRFGVAVGEFVGGSSDDLSQALEELLAVTPRPRG